MNIISMSVYGQDQKYIKGVAENYKLMIRYYPGWTLRIYHDNAFDTSQFKDCQLVNMSESKMHSGMFWRFLPAWEKNIQRVIFRDADSRLNCKEKAAVSAWIQSDKAVHCMHDHEHHRHKPIFGGMWGIKGGILDQASLAMLNNSMAVPQKRVADMLYLQSYIFPQVKDSILRHSSVKTRWPSVKFPVHAPYSGFIGEQIDA